MMSDIILLNYHFNFIYKILHDQIIYIYIIRLYVFLYYFVHF